MKMVWLLPAALLLVVGGICAAKAGETPADPKAFTQYMAQRIQLYIPAKVTIEKDLVLQLSYPNGAGVRMPVDAVFHECAEDHANCQKKVDDYIQSMARLFAPRQELNKKSRPEFLANMSAAIELDSEYSYRSHEGRQTPVARSIFGDFVEVCMLNPRTPSEPMSAGEIWDLGLTKSDAFVKCEENLRNHIELLSAQISDIPVGEMRAIKGSLYEASSLLLESDWRDVAARFGGQLLVAVPGFDVLIYAHGSDQALIDAVAKRAEEIRADEAKYAWWPLSTKVFQWTDTGWRQVTASRAQR